MVLYTNLTDLLADVDVDDGELQEVWDGLQDQKKYADLINNHPNLVVLCETYRHAQIQDNDPDCDDYRAWITLLKILALEFKRSKYWQSRIGWLMWFWVCYAKYDSYYPMKWKFHYDPMNMYRHDEPERPPELERTMPEDPFNLQGKCFVHPEWYKEDGSMKERFWEDKDDGHSGDSS